MQDVSHEGHDSRPPSVESETPTNKMHRLKPEVDGMNRSNNRAWSPSPMRRSHSPQPYYRSLYSNSFINTSPALFYIFCFTMSCYHVSLLYSIDTTFCSNGRHYYLNDNWLWAFIMQNDLCSLHALTSASSFKKNIFYRFMLRSLLLIFVL